MLALGQPMGHFMVNAVTCEVQEAKLDLGVSTVKNVLMAVFAAVGFLLAGVLDSHAADRRATKQYTPYTQTASSSVAQDGALYERKCMTLSCGSTWCYNVRR